MTHERILVWDWPVRIGHWLLAGSFLICWLTSESERLRLIHVTAGGVMLGVLLFRLIWGVIGSSTARFSNFLRSPRAALEYLRRLAGRHPEHYTGHNPAGGLAILLMIALGLLTAGSGWLNYNEFGGEWLEEAHEALASSLLLVVIIHLAGVLIGSWRHHENLPRAMLTGHKLGIEDEAIATSRPWAVLPLLICIASSVWLVLH